MTQTVKSCSACHIGVGNFALGVNSVKTILVPLVFKGDNTLIIVNAKTILRRENKGIRPAKTLQGDNYAKHNSCQGLFYDTFFKGENYNSKRNCENTANKDLTS